MLVVSACRRLFHEQVLTVSAKRVNTVQEFAITFTGDTTDDGGNALLSAASTHADVTLTFDSANMNWACSSESAITTLPVRIHNDSTKYWENIVRVLTLHAQNSCTRYTKSVETSLTNVASEQRRFQFKKKRVRKVAWFPILTRFLIRKICRWLRL